MPSPNKPRCSQCKLHLELCYCVLIPRIETRTRVVVLMHAQETKKATNTGSLAHRCLPNSEIRIRGTRDRAPLDLSGLVDDSHETWMLYLSDRSEPLTPALAASLTKPVRLLVLDGNWSQANRLGVKLARELPPSVRHVKLTQGAPSEYKLRKAHHSGGVATMEAIARALGVLEGAHVREPLEDIFRVMRDRFLWLGGKLTAEAVTGGLPRSLSSY
jgi:DTW domain-containing protein YfiP